MDGARLPETRRQVEKKDAAGNQEKNENTAVVVNEERAGCKGKAAGRGEGSKDRA